MMYVCVRRSADPPTPADRKGERVREKELAAPLLELFRPSLPWGFATGSGSLFGAAAALDTVQEHKQQQQERRAFSCFYTDFRRCSRQFLGAILELFRPSLPLGFAAGSGSIFGAAAAVGTVQEHKQQQQARRAFSCLLMSKS